MRNDKSRMIKSKIIALPTSELSGRATVSTQEAIPDVNFQTNVLFTEFETKSQTAIKKTLLNRAEEETNYNSKCQTEYGTPQLDETPLILRKIIFQRRKPTTPGETNRELIKSSSRQPTSSLEGSYSSRRFSVKAQRILNERIPSFNFGKRVDKPSINLMKDFIQRTARSNGCFTDRSSIKTSLIKLKASVLPDLTVHEIEKSVKLPKSKSKKVLKVRMSGDPSFVIKYKEKFTVIDRKVLKQAMNYRRDYDMNLIKTKFFSQPFFSQNTTLLKNKGGK